MGKQTAVYIILGFVFLAACQPQVIYVEVTRSTAVEPPKTVQTVPIEVTRLVQQLVTRTITAEMIVEVTAVPLGSAQRPVQLLFPPVVNSTIISSRGETLAQALAAQTGLHFAVGLVDSEQNLIDLLCLAPADTVAFLSPVGYVLAHDQCQAQPGFVAVDANGQTGQAEMIIVRSAGSSTPRRLEDLSGQRWAIGNANSLPTRYIQAQLAADAVELAAATVYPADNSSLLAVVDGQADFATATFLPPVLPFDERPWTYGEDSPELWRQLGLAPYRSGFGYVLVNGEPEQGGYRVRDARAGLFDTRENIFVATRIITTTPPIPNVTVAFGANFPLGAADAVGTALADFTASSACVSSLCSTDFYGWSGLAPAEDAAYAPLRFIVQTLALPISDLLE